MTADECCPEARLSFAGNRRVCARHATDDDKALVAECDRRGRAIGLPEDASRVWGERHRWPTGPSVDTRVAMLDWAEGLGLKLYTGRRARTWFPAYRPPELDRGMSSWHDHQTEWTGTGTRVLVSHPYDLLESELIWLAAIGASVSQDSWYSPNTCQVEIWHNKIAVTA